MILTIKKTVLRVVKVHKAKLLWAFLTPHSARYIYTFNSISMGTKKKPILLGGSVPLYDFDVAKIRIILRILQMIGLLFLRL